MEQQLSYFKRKGHSSSAMGYLDPENKQFSIENWKKFMKGELEDQESKALITGTNIHNYLENPSEFKIFPVDKPTDKLGEVADKTIEILKEKFSSNLIDIDISLALALNHVDYYNNLKPETRLSKAMAAKQYIETFIEYENEGYQILSANDKETIDGISKSLRKNKELSSLFFLEDDLLPDGIEILREVEIGFNYNDHICKSKLDLIIIDHNRKEVNIKDIKSYGLESNIYLYPYEFMFRKVYRQLAFYNKAVISWLKEQNLNYIVNSLSVISCSKREPYNVQEFFVPITWKVEGDNEVAKYFRRVGSVERYGHIPELMTPKLYIPTRESILNKTLYGT